MKGIQPHMEVLREKKLVGRNVTMSFARDKTKELWQQFMPGRNLIREVKGNDFYSVEIYPTGFFEQFDRNRCFQKWAAVEVNELSQLPAGMESLILPTGLYAVFIHKGPASDGPKTYEYIFRQWLPTSLFSLDDRPHFALMGERYKQDHPDSEEEIWIPVKKI